MALKATIYKAELSIADMDRNYYQEHALTIARHPSETDERVMIRLLAFALHADEALAFGKDLFDVEEPALWLKDLTGAIDTWIEVGQPDERRLMKASGRAEHVVVYSYSAVSNIWFKQIAKQIDRARNITVVNIPAETSSALERMAKRNMQLQCTIQDGQVWLTDGADTVQVERDILLAERSY
ncbi:YaeQ family protein [Massilia sp. LXY-6]|uniref:YaeQ family protein n=1 Tax=Massilia sp. LXY-6 TaxID=3379823 RepID=UPI003EE3D6F3